MKEKETESLYKELKKQLLSLTGHTEEISIRYFDAMALIESKISRQSFREIFEKRRK
jgi:hypothetical protein